MKLLTKTFLILIIKTGDAQTPIDFTGQKIDYGFTTSTFLGSLVNKKTFDYPISEGLKFQKNNVPNTNYGWKMGMFFWINLSPCFAYKPEIDFTFGINSYKNRSYIDKPNFSTFVGIEFKPQLIIRLGCWNSQPVIKLARNMSYYLEGKQHYIIIGPKINYQKLDKLYSNNNVSSQGSVGFVFGFGIDNLFPNLSVAPELLFSLERIIGNSSFASTNSNNNYASLSLGMNFF